jgi:hypothetical protein
MIARRRCRIGIFIFSVLVSSKPQCYTERRLPWKSAKLYRQKREKRSSIQREKLDLDDEKAVLDGENASLHRKFELRKSGHPIITIGNPYHASFLSVAAHISACPNLYHVPL